MFCPGCGSEERQRSQYCRACGTHLRAVRAAVEEPDAITASAASARDEIGHTIAAKIKQFQSAGDLRQLPGVLAVLDGFLASPEEKRLQRLRAGVITASVGFGVMLTFFLVGISIKEEALFFPAGAGLIAFLIGLGMVINGLVFSLPRKHALGHLPEAHAQKALDQLIGPAAITDSNLASANPIAPPSITEHTTHQLADDPERARRARLRQE